MGLWQGAGGGGSCTIERGTRGVLREGKKGRGITRFPTAAYAEALARRASVSDMIDATSVMIIFGLTSKMSCQPR